MFPSFLLLTFRLTDDHHSLPPPAPHLGELSHPCQYPWLLSHSPAYSDFSRSRRLPTPFCAFPGARLHPYFYPPSFVTCTTCFFVTYHFYPSTPPLAVFLLLITTTIAIFFAITPPSIRISYARLYSIYIHVKTSIVGGI